MRLLLLAFLALVAEAYGGASTFTEEFCFTAFGSSSTSPVPTASERRSATFTFGYKTTVTPTRTVTPVAVTATSTVFRTTTLTTTVSKSASTGTVTSTVYSTQTQRSTVTAVTTSTTTATTTLQSTVTVPTSPGFMPVRSVVSAQGISNRKRDVAATSHPAQSTPKYPTSVNCKVYVEVVSISATTYTASSTKTVTAKTPTSTVTTTSTIRTTTTSRVVPAPTTTTSFVTSSLTTTVTSTVTSTSTVTTTTAVVGPVVTSYDACASDNFITFVDDQGYTDVPLGPYNDNSGTRAPPTEINNITAVSCCSQCQAAGDACGSFVYTGPGNYAAQDDESHCIFVFPAPNGAACSPNYNAGSFYAYPYGSQGVPYLTIGDSGCGYMDYDGFYLGD